MAAIDRCWRPGDAVVPDRGCSAMPEPGMGTDTEALVLLRMLAETCTT
ncbi:MAG: hypothetical protein M3460_09410 [Actinomycetota bacterium]|nr:hypothetical protein [Actinomycetota bacterium]